MTGHVDAIGEGRSRVWRGRFGWGLPWYVSSSILLGAMAAALAFSAYSLVGSMLLVYGTLQVMVLGRLGQQLVQRPEGVEHLGSVVPWTHMTGVRRTWIGDWIEVDPPVRHRAITVKGRTERIPLWRYHPIADDGEPIAKLAARVERQSRDRGSGDGAITAES